MKKEEFVKEQMKLSKEDVIANYWYTFQDNVERLGIEHQLELKDKKIERLNNIIDELIDIITSSLDVDIVEKRFNMNFDNFKIWLKEELKRDDKE